MMPNLRNIFKPLALVLATGLACLSGTAAHASGAPCGVTGVSASASPVVYDPFNPAGLASTNIVMNISRVNPGGGGTTSVLNFYLKANPSTGSAANNTALIPLSISGQASLGGAGINIFYNYTSTPPNLLPISISPSGTNRFAKISFTGNNEGSDTVAVTFQVSLPANLDLNAVQSLAFDAFFSCNTQGGHDNGETQTGSRPNAVVFPVTVLSALRTYYAGTALDFGEIGNITTASLTGTPQKTLASNHVFVQSSGAYSVTLSSQNGYKLKRTGATTGADEVAYSLRFLGFNRNTSSGPAGSVTISRNCQRATLSTTGNSLPIQATLLEGGSGKTPSSTYNDVLTITITPLVYGFAGGDLCGTYGL